jgi:hypothetical protein
MVLAPANASKAGIQEPGRKKPKTELERFAESKELRQACVSCRVSVYWEGEDKFFRVCYIMLFHY